MKLDNLQKADFAVLIVGIIIVGSLLRSDSCSGPRTDMEGSIREKDLTILKYMEQRWDFYELRDGIYLPERHDNIVFEDAAKKFGISKDQAFEAFNNVEKVRWGAKQKEVIFLDPGRVTVEVTLLSISLLPGNILEITFKNESDKQVTLPTINLTLDLYKGSRKIGQQIVWMETLGYLDTKTYKSLPISYDFDSVQGTGLMNVGEMNSRGLRSAIQDSNDPGETVIPVFRTTRSRVK